MSPTLDPVDRKQSKGDEQTGSSATTISTDRTDSNIHTYDRSSDRVNLPAQSSSEPTVSSSKRYDGSTDHPVSSSTASSFTAEIPTTEETQDSTLPPNASSSKKVNNSGRSSLSIDSTGTKEKPNNVDTTSIPDHNPQRPSSKRTTSETDARGDASKRSSYSPDDYRSTSAVIRQTQSGASDDQAHNQAKPSNLDVKSLPKSSNRDDSIVAYIPYLPIDDFTDRTLELTIAECLKVEYSLRVVKIICSLHLDVGIVYLRSEEDKNDLVNKIKKVLIGPNSNKTISFVDELQVVSYVVFESKDITYRSTANDILQQCIKQYSPLSCDELSSQFPNIFRIVTNVPDEIINIAPIEKFSIKNQTVTVYFNADCCFFGKLPTQFYEDGLKSALSKHLIEKKISKESIYIQYDKARAIAVVLTCGRARRMASICSMHFDEIVTMKKDKFTYRLKILSVPNSIMISCFKNLSVFAGTVVRAMRIRDDVILEVLDKTVYYKCLKQRSLHIDGHTLYVETCSSHYDDEDDWEIDAYNWYETDMSSYKSDIMEFVSRPEHPIFRFKWNSEAFLEQFHRWTLHDQSTITTSRDNHRSIGNQQRHLLRMTVMLNTIGVLKKGSYRIGYKEITLRSDQLKTIVYNHQSKLQSGMTKFLSSPIDFLHKITSVSVVNEDCLVAYERFVSQGYRPLLLNMANAYAPGGGYRRGDGAQEENLFRRSNYYRSLDMELDDGKPTARFYCASNGELKKLAKRELIYPMDEFGAIYTSGLTVFRQPENAGYDFMNQPMHNVCSIAIAAYRNPKLDSNNGNRLSSKYSIHMRKKIENIFAIAHHHKHDCLILSAFGCGAFRNPPKHIATIFQSVIEQYAGFFRKICFAIIDDHNSGQELNPYGNYLPFKDLLDGLKVEPRRNRMLDMMIGPWRISKETSKGEITLSDIKICDLRPCRYGGICKELGENRHYREFLHPPLCPFTVDSKHCPEIDNDDHKLWFRHRIKCPQGARCHLTDNSLHLNYYEHNKITRDEIRCEGASLEENHSMLERCPFTPFHCPQHTKLSESRDIRTLPSYILNHCREFLHMCRFGRQCDDKSSLHLKTTLHIPRHMCQYDKKCTKLYLEDHMNSFTHEGIADIRRMCIHSAYECRDLQKIEHIVRFRHNGNHDRSSIIQYRGLNDRLDFVRNQQIIIGTITDYAEKLLSKTSLSILTQILNFIKALLPIYQCSKETFESILVHGHVMSNKYMEKLKSPKSLIKIIRKSKQIGPIFDKYKDQSVENRITAYIEAIVYNKHEKRVHSAESTVPYTRTQTSMPNRGHSNIIYEEEKVLKSMLKPQDFDSLHRYIMEIVETSLNLQIDLTSIEKTFEEHIYTILGPQLSRKYGDIVLVFKREVMLHPDANFSIQSEDSFLNRTVFTHRPWIKDSGTLSERIKQFQESVLHCSILGYEHAAAAELVAAAGTNKRTMDIDLQAVLKHWKSVSSDQSFEGHLPDLIPLDYIAEVYIPRNVFASLTPAAQKLVKSTFRDSLHITRHEINRNSAVGRESYMLDEKRSEYQDYVTDKLVENLRQNMEGARELRGIVITLPPSSFEEYVALPFTIGQIYANYRRNTKRDSISDEIYIYWQAMYGDMMVILSKEPIEIDENRQHIQCLICYISETPSTTTTDYKESYSYLNYGYLHQHETVMSKQLFLASSNIFHRGCNVENFLTYCLKLEKTTGQVTLSHAGPNSIYNQETISHKFTKSNLDLHAFNHIYISVGSRQVPIRNMIVSFHEVPDLHPSIDKNFKRASASSRQQNVQSSDRSDFMAASKDKQPIGKSLGFDMDKKKLKPCPDTVNCLQQMLDEHSKRYSHPCRFSELCRNQDKEPYLTHEPHQVERCLHDKSCKQLDDPFHRVSFRHTNLPDFLIPCRDQRACLDLSVKHRIKYSHGERVDRMAKAPVADKPRMLFLSG